MTKHYLDGKELCLRDLAKLYGMNHFTLYSRLKRGLSLSEALTEPVKVIKQMVTLHGTTRSIVAWAKIYNINPGTVYSRVASGMSVLEALTKPTHRCEVIVAFDEARTTKQWAKAAGLTRSGFDSRRQRGLTGEDLIAPRMTDRGLKAFGRIQSYAAWGREYKIHPDTLRVRVKDMGLKPEIALTLPVDQSRKRKRVGPDNLIPPLNRQIMTAFGETKSYQEWCEMYEMGVSTLRYRLTKRKPPMSPEEALLTPVAQTRPKEKK